MNMRWSIITRWTARCGGWMRTEWSTPRRAPSSRFLEATPTRELPWGDATTATEEKTRGSPSTEARSGLTSTSSSLTSKKGWWRSALLSACGRIKEETTRPSNLSKSRKFSSKQPDSVFSFLAFQDEKKGEKLARLLRQCWGENREDQRRDPWRLVPGQPEGGGSLQGGNSESDGQMGNSRSCWRLDQGSRLWGGHHREVDCKNWGVVWWQAGNS